jgi:hypothetical protein
VIFGAGASGRHYASTGTLPMIPGVDGVGRLPDGRRVYFVVPDDTWGSMADQAVVDLRRTVPLPDDVDVIKVAAAMNPAMSACGGRRGERDRRRCRPAPLDTYIRLANPRTPATADQRIIRRFIHSVEPMRLTTREERARTRRSAP